MNRGLIALVMICAGYSTFAAAETRKESREQFMTVMGIEYRNHNTSGPYLVEGEISGSQRPRISYKLACKLGADDLQVGHQYKVSEGSDENGIKVLFIELTIKQKPGLIGIECEIQSEKIGSN